jgi:hypothetical protein
MSPLLEDLSHPSDTDLIPNTSAGGTMEAMIRKEKRRCEVMKREDSWGFQEEDVLEWLVQLMLALKHIHGHKAKTPQPPTAPP